jgi:site-specific DNA recombinase
MSTAILYIRVSTDEQAIKGYSQRTQHDRLMKFCLARNIEILDTIYEDYSAQTFKRPAWSPMMHRLKRNKSLRPDIILFTKWDRFSRNTGDAYYMITQLHHLDIQAQAIDQELDMSIPENKIILAVFISVAEAENDRRSLNVKQSLHKAKLEGRWTAHIPLGYKYQIDENGKKSMGPNEPDATIIRVSFKKIAVNEQTIKSVYNQAVLSGLKCSISNFCRILKNPVYCGKVAVPAFEKESACVVNGLHAGIIGEDLFNNVQAVLKHRHSQPIKHTIREELFLRGFFHCPKCDKKLIGSASKAKSGRHYFYYHCASACGFRVRADFTNNLFRQRLNELCINREYLDLYTDILKHTRIDLFAEKLMDQKIFSQNIDRLIQRIVKAKELLLKGEIETEDYIIIKNDCEQSINQSGIELQHSAALERRKTIALNKAVLQLFSLGIVFDKMSLPDKRSLLTTLLVNSPVMDTTLQASELLRPGAQFIFGFENVVHQDYQKKLPQDKDWEIEYNEKIVRKIFAIQEKISRKASHEIIRFLTCVALVTTKNNY